MDEIWKQMASPVFWVCTVALGLLSSLLMHFLLRALDKKISGWSASRKLLREAQSESFRADLKLLAENAELVPLYVAKEQRLRAIAFTQAVGGMSTCYFASLLLLQNGPVVTTFAGIQYSLAILAAAYFIWRGGDLFLDSRRQAGVLESLYAKLRAEKIGSKLIR